MGAFHAWIWSSDGEPVVEPDLAGPGPGLGWQLIGEVDTEAAPKLYAAVQRRLHLKGGRTPKSVQGYLSGDPRQQAAQEIEAGPSQFHLAVGPLGATGGYLVTRLPARLASLTTPPPEPHPGLIVQPMLIGIEITGDEHGHFDRID